VSSELHPLAPPAIVRHVDQNLVELDARVDRAEDDGIRARWEFGRALLRERIGKQLPAGRLDALAELTGKSRQELGRRMTFAERFPTEGEVSHVVSNFTSWHAIVNELLSSTAHLSSATDEWATPQELFDELDAEFGFDLDVCASDGNAKCERRFTQADNGLDQVWRGTCWMNPPYSQIELWMQKAYESSQAGATVVCLVPSRTDVGWTWEWARRGEVRFLRGRLKFVDDEGNTGPAPFPSAIVIYPRPPSVVWWDSGL
jgi:phage N-6-adenine-methyltransferase